MKRLIFLLLFFSVSFSLLYGYEDPPVSSVVSQNGITAGELSDSLNGSAAKNGTLFFDWYGRSLLMNSSMRIAGFTLLIDGATTAGENSRVVIEKGGKMQHIMRKRSEGLRCDRDFFETYGDDSSCNFDDDSCSEYEYSSDIFYTIDITFLFKDLNVTVSAPEESIGVFGISFDNALTNTVSIPPEIESAMENASGNENLTVVFNGTATMVYGIDNRSSGGTSCISRFSTASKTVYFGENKTYPVEGKHKLVFTVSPLLDEQWYKNNRFDNAVLSQSRLYKGKVYLDGGVEKEFSLYVFNVTENSFGLKEIISIPSNDSNVFAGVVDVNPYQLDESNQSYAFFYQFNFSYPGLGEKELALNVKDFFGNEKTINRTITSRQLSYNSNQTETGGNFDPETTRKSAPYTEDSLEFLEIGFGMVGVLLVLLLLYQIRR